MENSFIDFINKTPPTGKAVVCLDSENVKKILRKIKNKNIITYGESKKADYKIKRIKYNLESISFDLNFKDKLKKNKYVRNITVKLLGNTMCLMLQLL